MKKVTKSFFATCATQLLIRPVMEEILKTAYLDLISLGIVIDALR